MADQQTASVIRRKTRAAREGADSRVISPVRALRLALARAAETLLDLPLVVATVEQRRVEAAEVEAALRTLMGRGEVPSVDAVRAITSPKPPRVPELACASVDLAAFDGLLTACEEVNA